MELILLPVEAPAVSRERSFHQESSVRTFQNMEAEYPSIFALVTLVTDIVQGSGWWFPFSEKLSESRPCSSSAPSCLYAA